MSSLAKVALLLAASASATVLPLIPNQGNAILLTSIASAEGCLQSSYYGRYGGSSKDQEHIYIPSGECLASLTFSEFASGSGSIVPLDTDVDGDVSKGRIIWIGQAGVEPNLQDGVNLGAMGTEEAWALIKERATLVQSYTSTTHKGERGETADSQQVFSIATTHEPLRLLHRSASSLLLHVPISLLPVIDTFLPSHTVPVALPLSPLPSTSSYNDDERNIWDSVPSKYVDNLRNLTSKLKFSGEIDRIVSEGVELNSIRRDVRWLTGEAPSGIESRHSFTEGAVKAANYIKAKVEATGANCTLQPFLHGFSPNVICTYPSSLNSTEHVILSAHYDSRGSFGSTRAPGGDDDGSGSGHLLGVAHAIHTQGVKFQKKVVLAFFAGEEQGLLGSHAYAEYLHSQNTTVLLQVQADMLGYHAPGEPLQLGLPESIHLPEASYLIGNLSSLYSPELVIGTTAACCSDHQSFVSFGYPATQVFERNGWIADPYYHNSGDLSQREGYDFDQIVSIAKVTLSALLTVAGYKLK